MGIQSRSLLQQQFELSLERANPLRLKLIRANNYTCTDPNCFINGRQSYNENCSACAGTGYQGVTFDPNNVGLRLYNGQPYDDTVPPSSQFYYITADLQTGHGLYGAGGDYLKLLADLGKQNVGDATLFTKLFDRDRQTGASIYPLVLPSLVRPDRIISRDGDVYNIVQQQIIDIGSERLGRVFTLEKGSFSAVRGIAKG